jgi:hypothetical protein
MTRRALQGAAFVLLAAASIAPTGAAGGFLTFVLGPDGVVYSWTAGDADLSPLPPSLARLAGHPVNDLAMSGEGGKAVVLPVASHRTGARRNRLEGSAVVISSPTTTAPPAILNEIAFEGDGRRVAVSKDGRFAYVLAILTRPDPAGGEVRARLSALDLDEGRVLASAQLDKPPSAIALDPAGTRLYLAYAGRIQTYTTHPLAQSWHYRSPGANRGLCFRPHGTVLYAARLAQIALFDPAVIAGRKPEERQKLQDDATAVIPLPFAADSLLFSRDGTLAAASGPGNVLAFFEPGSGTIVTTSVDGAGSETRQEVRPFYFGQGPGDLVVAIFPEKRVRAIAPPASLIQAATVNNLKLLNGAVQIPYSQSSPPATADTPKPDAATPPTATPTPSPTPAAAEPSDVPPVLAGRLSGRIDAVRAIVIYGPGSIVREQARAVPDADGAWRIPLPAPGSYRIVPLGEGSRPVRSEPNFHTLDVKDQGVTGLDFKILGTS